MTQECFHALNPPLACLAQKLRVYHKLSLEDEEYYSITSDFDEAWTMEI